MSHYESQSEDEASAEDETPTEPEARRSKPDAGWGAIKAKLKVLSPTDVVNLVRDLYRASPENRQFVQGRLAPSAANLEEYRNRVIDAVYPDPLSRKAVRIGEAERLIRHYRLSTGDEPETVDLMLTLVEAGTEQAADLAFGDESYFVSLERVLEAVVKAFPSLPDSARADIVERLRDVRERSSSTGYGYGDAVREITAPVTSLRAQRAPSRRRSRP